MGTTDIARLRRMALAQQGLNRRKVFGAGRNAVHKAIERTGYVQIDTISVVARAHHHMLFSRVPNYQPKMLDQLVSSGKVFEYWYHAAAFLPMRDYRFALPRMERYRSGAEKWQRSRDKKLMREVLARIRTDGPLRSSDFEDTNHQASGWWNWKPAKRALEQLFMEGRLIIVARNGFQKTYDLPERSLPNDVDTSMPTLGEYACHLLDSNLGAHGSLNPKVVTHLRRHPELRKAVDDEIAARLDQRTLVSLDVPGGRPWIAEPEHFETRLASIDRSHCRLLSPFDPLVIHRDRANALFGFDYVIECYVPKAKRVHGYFCLPILLGEHLIGRVDAKAHRQQQHLEVKHLQLDAQHLEAMDDPAKQQSLANALHEFASFNECTTVSISRCTPNNLHRAMSKILSEDNYVT